MVALFDEGTLGVTADCDGAGGGVGGGSYAADVMGRLHAALAEVASVAGGALPKAELETFTIDMVRANEISGAITATVVADADEARISGRKSLNSHLAGLLGTASSHVAPHRTLGLWLRHFFEFAHAWTAGVLSEAHVRELKKLDNGRTHHSLQRDQHLFVEWAQTLEFTDWLKALAYWLLAADPDGELEPERAASYGVTFRTDRNGDVHLQGTLDPISGDALQKAVEHEAQKILKGQTDAQSQDPGSDVMPVRKRRLVGLMRLVNRGFARQDGTVPFPLVNIVMSQRIAEALLQDLLNGTDTAAELLDPFDIDGRS